jgi:hypothetical protein
MGPQSTAAKDKILLALAALALVIVLGWYAYEIAITSLSLGIPGNPTTYFLVSVLLPSAGITTILLILGFVIQLHHPRPQLLFLAFVFTELLGWFAGLVASVWIYTARASANTSAVSALSDVSVVAYPIALFLLFVLALFPVGTQSVEEESPTPPEEPLL